MRTRSIPVEVRALLWLGAVLAFGYAVGCALPHGPRFHPGGFVSKAFAWDSEHYEQIALHGYQRDQTGAPTLLIAFFPGWPVIESVLMTFAGSTQMGRGLAALFSGCVGIVSVVAFARLARSALPTEGAELATLLYALYPGAHFLFQPYPTALMQLCTILVLQNLVTGRLWRAAVISGLATSFGPLMVFVGLAVMLTACIAAWRDRRTNPGAFRRFCVLAPVLGAVAFSGLLLFMLWQARAFGDPLAFVAAGRAWEVPMALTAHAERALALALTVPDLLRAGTRLHMAMTLAGQGQWSEAQISFEDAVDLLVLFIMSAGAIVAIRLQAKPLALAAILVIAGFIWFAGAPQGGQAAIRLIYPAIGCFLGLGSLATASPAFAWVLPPVFAVLLVLDQAFLVAGYWVV